MAQVFGEAGRNATDEAYKRFRRFCLLGILGVAVSMLIAGYGIGSVFPVRHLSPLGAFAINLLLYGVVFLLGRFGLTKLEAFDKERVTWRKGAVGEVLISGILEDLPDEYAVIHDVTKRFGNIDHVVIGPTGVFVVDTKNWKGTVKSDGNGELLVNGRAYEKSPIKALTRSAMDFREKLRALTEAEYFVRGVIAFPISYVEANFGTTGHVHCVTDERLIEYIQNQTFSQKLEVGQINRIKKAVLQMAGMDERFNGRNVS